MNDYLTALRALAPIIVAGLAMLGLATLLVNGGIGWMILVDQCRLRRRARATGRSVDELMDGDDWAAHVAEAVALTETPIYAALSREQFVADAMAEIDELTGGVA